MSPEITLQDFEDYTRIRNANKNNEKNLPKFPNLTRYKMILLMRDYNYYENRFKKEDKKQ